MFRLFEDNRIKYSPATLALRRLSGSDNGWHLAHNADANGNPKVFNLNHNEDDLWLNTNNAHPDNHWNGNNRFVFRRRNSLRFSLDFLVGRVFVCSFLSRFHN